MRAWGGVALIVVAAAASSVRAAPATKVYWAQTLSEAIRQSNLDGTSPGSVVETPTVADVVGLSFDGVAGKVYWVEARSLDDKILRANPDGSSVETVVAWPNVVGPVAVAVDPGSGFVCWAEDHPTDSEDRIACADLGGTNPRTLVAWPVLVNPTALAFDTLGSGLYWLQRVSTDDKVMRANLDGSQAQPIVSWPVVADPTALAVDALSGKVYWSQATASDDRILRANLDGSGVETVVSSPLVIAPVAVAVDPSGGKVYWAEDQTVSDRIARVNLNGTGVQTIVGFVDVGDPVGLALDGVVADQPAALSPDGTGINKNRFISFDVVGGVTTASAIRVTLANLPGAHSTWNGARLWVGPPGAVCELGGIGPGQTCQPGVPLMTAAGLRCLPECRTDWSRRGTIHVFHEAIVPAAMYTIEIADCTSDLNDPASFRTPLSVSTTVWGDAVGGFVGGVWTGPNGRVEIVTDVVAVLDKFGSRPGAPIKARADVEPRCPDRKVNISDVARVLDAFRALPYPFGPSVADPCSATCP
jgi:DNA-binding beta-propeller fold protein YncE